MSDLIEIEIDGKKIQAKPQQTVIQAADENGIYIPRFCYHKELSIAANCRMCLVDIEKSPKPMPACAMPVAPGMKISTKSAKTVSAQRAVMEFLLINHPLDCPICDQGGECELQDLSLSYGAAQSNFCEGKRAVTNPDIGPLVATEMTRCIQCTRCVRFGDEIAGLRELGAINRGEDMTITTYVQHALHSELSGNIIDLCPVGALVAKPSRFKARPWELIQYPSISPHDCVGTNINLHARDGAVIRAVPRHNPEINDMWIADRDRFSYEALNHEDRITHPMVKLDGQWEKTDWMPALDFAVGGFRRVMATSSGDYMAGLISPNSTLEELFLLQKILRGLGSSNIDHRLRQTDFRDQAEMPLVPGLGAPIAELETADSILLIGSNIQREQPLLGLRLRKAYLKGAAITAINMVDYKFHFRLKAKKIVAPHEMVNALAGVAKALSNGQSSADKILEQVAVDDHHREMANLLKQGKKSFVLVGSLAFNHPQASILRRLARLIGELTGAKVGFLTEGANTAGAWLAGAVPHRKSGGKVNNQIG
ncbi:MAG TPA: NADH-quinone oxidoreductase subunit NuoG, partial [Gammaproteobacteria bacterium]|nr:NADH-quinone oxidoreductase subunit NuoG [Gammaproteobacteria bacterium]